jgi:hypothetical protein
MNGHTHGAKGSMGKAASTSVTWAANPGRKRRPISAYASIEYESDGGMSHAALRPVRVWSSVGRNLVGSSGFAVAPIGKM